MGKDTEGALAFTGKPFREKAAKRTVSLEKFVQKKEKTFLTGLFGLVLFVPRSRSTVTLRLSTIKEMANPNV